MMFWRAHTQSVGDHIRVRLFVSEHEDYTHAGVGELIMRQPEWDDLVKRLDIRVTKLDGVPLFGAKK